MPKKMTPSLRPKIHTEQTEGTNLEGTVLIRALLQYIVTRCIFMNKMVPVWQKLSKENANLT